MHIDAQTVTLIFTIVTGIGVLLQAAVLFGIALGLRETQKKLLGLTERLEEHLGPILSTSRGVLEDLSPKVKTITNNLVDASGTLRAQAENVGHVITDAAARTRHQTARVDSMISTTLNNIGYATAAVEKSVAVPLRQVNGILAGLRAGIETLGSKAEPRATRPPVPHRSVRPTDSDLRTATPIVEEPMTPAPPRETFTEAASEKARQAAATFVRDKIAADRR